MDEMHIGSKYLQGIISKIVKSVIRKKLGVEADVQFNDPISVTFDGENANVHVNVNATLGRDDLDKLLKDLI